MTYLFDSSILIGHLRHGLPEASEWVAKVERRVIKASVSTITAYEIYKGAITPGLVREYKFLFSRFAIQPLSRQIVLLAGEMYRGLPKEHQKPFINLDLLIAATAEYYRLELVTTNKKHFNLFNFQHVNLIYL